MNLLLMVLVFVILLLVVIHQELTSEMISVGQDVLGDRGKSVFNSITCFRTNESYSNISDLNARQKNNSDFYKKYDEKQDNTSVNKEELFAFLQKFRLEQKENSKQQEKMNKSWRVRQIEKQRRKREVIKNIRNFFKSLTIRDYSICFFYLGVPLVFVLVLSHVECLEWIEETIVNIVQKSIVDIYLSQLSLTFITISLMSIFSDSSAIIFWENIVKKTLIDPPASCFKSYFSYSFIYLLASTVCLVWKYDLGLVVFFVFNIVCLFDLSRTMINCYYDPKRKEKKVVNEFIREIEKANLRQKDSLDVKATFEEFNYYINEAFKCEKYTEVRRDLGVYGKLLAHVDTCVINPEEVDVMGWYNKKTYGAYKDLVRSYYEECNSIAVGLVNTNALPLSQDIHRNIIREILTDLINDIPNYREKMDVEHLIMYVLHTNILFVARNIDVDNLEKYLIEVDKETKNMTLENWKKHIEKSVDMLMTIFYERLNADNSLWEVYKSDFEFAIKQTIGQLVLLKDKKLLVKEVEFLCWDKLKMQEEFKEIEYYIDEKKDN